MIIIIRILFYLSIHIKRSKTLSHVSLYTKRIELDIRNNVINESSSRHVTKNRISKSIPK